MARLAVIVLAMVLTAGCLPGTQAPSDETAAGPAPQDRVVTPPAPGASAVYEGDNRRLMIQAVGTADRLDGDLEIQDALILEYTFWPEGPEKEPFLFEEAVDPETGLILQQVARCGIWTRDEAGDKVCYDERATVLFSPEGLPGGLGAAPFWNLSIDAPPGRVAIESPYIGSDNASYTWSSQAARGASLDPGCLRATVDAGEQERVRRFGFTGGLADMVLCEGVPFPQAFQAADGSRFHRISSEVGEPPAPPTDAGPWQGPRLSKAERSFPLFASHPEFETEFPTREAHEAAMRLSGTYASLFEEGSDGTLVGTRLHFTHHTQTADTRDSKTFQRRLLAVDGSGEAVDLTIERERTRTTVGPHEETNTTYEVLSDQVSRWTDPPTRGELPRQQADVAAAVGFGEAVSGSDLDAHALVGLRPNLHRTAWFATLHNVPISDGYTVVAFYEDPIPQESPLSVPYEVDVHGPTARPLWFHTPQEALPFGS